MKKSRFRALAVVLASAAVVTVAPSPAAALPTLPTEAGNITPEINWTQFLSPLVQASEISCTITSVTGTNAVTVGQKLEPMKNQMTDGLTLLTVARTPISNVGADCTSEVTIPTTTFNVSGSFTAPGMANVAGVGSTGTVAMVCAATSPTPKVTFTVSAAFGGAVAGKVKITGKAGASNIAFDCSLSLAFAAGAALAGTVEGTIAFADSVNNSLCTAQTALTCVQASVANATVTITGGSGALADASGTGTYSFNDIFSLPGIESSLSMVTSMGVRTAGVRAAGATSNADQLLVTLLAGKHTVRMIRPKDSSGTLSVGAGGSIEVVSSPSAKCSLSGKLGTKTVSIGSSTLPKSGTASYAISSAVAKKMKAAKITAGKKFALTVSCIASKKTATLKKTVTYSG